MHEQRLGPKPDQNVKDSNEYAAFMKAIEDGIANATKEAGTAISQLQQLEGGDMAGNSTLEQIEEFHKTGKLKDGFPAKALQEFIRQTLKRFKDSGIGKSFFIEESLWEAEEIEDICNYEDFAHIALLDDLTVKSEMKHLLFDVYLDVSSSMASTRYLTKEMSKMRKIDMAKMLLVRLKRHGFIQNLYCFDNRVWEYDKDRIDSITTCGGTSIDTVLEQAKTNGRPCMIITDCEDNIETHYQNAFIMSVEPQLYGSQGMNDMIKSKNVTVYYKGSLKPPMAVKRGRYDDCYVHPLYYEENINQYVEQ